LVTYHATTSVYKQPVPNAGTNVRKEKTFMDRAHAAGVNTIGRVGDAYRRFIHKVAYAHQGKRENARNEKCKEQFA